MMTLDAREQMVEFHTSLSMILVFTVKTSLSLAASDVGLKS